MPTLGRIDAAFNSLGQRTYTSIVFKVGATYYARKADGTLISASTTFETVLSAACALRGTVLITGDGVGGVATNMAFSGGFTGIDLLADTNIIIDKSANLTVPNGYTGFVFRDHDQGYLSIDMYGQAGEAGSPAKNWTFLKLQSDNAGSGCIDTLLHGYGGQINNAGTAVELNSTGTGFVNGNIFSGLFIDRTPIGFKFVSSSNGPIHHNVFENIIIEGEAGGATREGFKDISGFNNSFINCKTIDFAIDDTSYKFLSSSKCNSLFNCLTEDGRFIDQGTQNVLVGCTFGLTASLFGVSSLMTRPDLTKMGTWYGSSSGNGEGILNGRLNTIAVGTGANSGGGDSTGIYRTFDTGATINSISGLRTDSTNMTRINNAFFKTALYLNSVTNVRVFAGFVGDAAAPTSAADPLNAKAGVALWFDSAVNANWRRLHNDTSGASVSDDTTLPAATATLYPVEIYGLDDTRFRFVFNDTSTDITTNIPASTTGLSFWVYMENTTGASRTYRNYYLVLRNDK